MPMFPRRVFRATPKKDVLKKFARLFFYTRKLLNNFLNINVMILGFGTANMIILRMCESKFEMLTPEIFFVCTFFTKKVISQNLGQSRAFFGPKIFV